MASAQVDAAVPVEEVSVQDINSAEVDEHTLPKSLEESEVVVKENEEEDELGEHEFEGEVKNLEDEENLEDEVTDSPIIVEDEPNATFDDDDDAEEGEESDKI